MAGHTNTPANPASRSSSPTSWGSSSLTTPKLPQTLLPSGAGVSRRATVRVGGLPRRTVAPVDPECRAGQLAAHFATCHLQAVLHLVISFTSQLCLLRMDGHYVADDDEGRPCRPGRHTVYTCSVRTGILLRGRTVDGSTQTTISQRTTLPCPRLTSLPIC